MERPELLKKVYPTGIGMMISSSPAIKERTGIVFETAGNRIHVDTTHIENEEDKLIYAERIRRSIEMKSKLYESI
jgi:hypothetical protein